MPYKVTKLINQPFYVVKNTVTGKVHSKGTTRERAYAQVRLLEAKEKKRT